MIRKTTIGGVMRQMIFDYARSGGEHRYVQLGLLPGATTPAFATRAPLEFWVRAGDLRVGGALASAQLFHGGLRAEPERQYAARLHQRSTGDDRPSIGG